MVVMTNKRKCPMGVSSRLRGKGYFMFIRVYYLLLNIHAQLTLLDGTYYGTMFVSFLYICTNPFIYATKFDPVKKVLLRLVPCIKTPEQPIEMLQVAASRTAHSIETFTDSVEVTASRTGTGTGTGAKRSRQPEK